VGVWKSICISRKSGCCLQVKEQWKCSPPVWEPAREKFGKYGIGKRSVGLVFANILIFVIDIPLPGRIFSACFWTSCVGTVSMTVSWRHGELLALNLSYCILGKKCEGGGHRKQRLGIGDFVNPPTRRSAKEIPRNGQVWKADARASKWGDNSSPGDVRTRRSNCRSQNF
jgi:hypothetical protein